MRKLSARESFVVVMLGVFGMLSWGSQAQTPASALAFTRIEDGPVAAAGGAIGAAWVDVDLDDDLDLFTVGTVSGGFTKMLFRNDGHGTFTEIRDGTLLETDGITLRGVSWGDYDNDGDPDVAVGGTPSRVYRNAGDGTFSPVELSDADVDQVRGWSPSWADYDNDGNLDLFITHPAGFAGISQPNHLFRNSGPPDYELARVSETALSAGFAPFTSGNWSDFDADGDLDLFVGSGPANGTRGRDHDFRNLLAETGTATFERIEGLSFADQPRDGQVVNWVDIDNDRDLDVFVTNWGGQSGGLPNDLYRNDDGRYVRVTTGDLVSDSDVSLANMWGDLDNDGDQDVVVVNSGRTGLYRNDGHGTFTRVADGPLATDSGTSWGGSLGDMDNDGDLDVVIPALRTFSEHRLYRNDLANDNAWIELDLVGTRSNRSGIGAKVHVRATIHGEDVWQMREVASQNSFLGHNMLRVHVGLGDAPQVDELMIEWPSGTVDRFTDVASDRRWAAHEGGGLTPLN